MLVSEKNFDVTLRTLLQEKNVGLDTETYGLGWDDAMFSLILSNSKITLYYNFNLGADHLGNYAPEEYRLDREWALTKLREMVFNDDTNTVFIHNAKYDLRRLAIEGIEVKGKVHCTMTAERLVRNDYLDYSLDGCAKRRQLEKSPAVEACIVKQKLYDWVQIPGKKTRAKNKKYYQVPFEIIVPYAELDARLCYQIGMEQKDVLSK